MASSAKAASVSGASPHTLKREYYDALRQLTVELSGIQLGRDCAFLIETRLATLAREEGFESLADLVEDLFASGQNRLAVRVVSTLLERDTRFFEDLPSLGQFTKTVLPRLRSAITDRPIRLLSFGCASGQEAWTLAMLMRQIERRTGAFDWQVIGVDYPSAALERARTGVYTHFEVQRGLPVQQLVANFEPHGADSWSVKTQLRDRVRFEDFHLLSKLDPLGEFDCTVFRGALARYSGPAQVRVVRGVSSVVREGGYLLMGSNESITEVNSNFDAVDGMANLYRRRIPPPPPKRTRFGSEDTAPRRPRRAKETLGKRQLSPAMEALLAELEASDEADG